MEPNAAPTSSMQETLAIPEPEFLMLHRLPLEPVVFELRVILSSLVDSRFLSSMAAL